MKMEWKTIAGVTEMTPLEMNGISLSSEKHTPVSSQADAADVLPGFSGGNASKPIKKTSLGSLSSLK